MKTAPTHLGRTLSWGAATAALYAGLYYFADDLIRLAHTTVDACMVVENGHGEYYHGATPELCAREGGEFVKGNWLHVLAPIATAFVFSYVHGIFTGLFWDTVGLRPARR